MAFTSMVTELNCRENWFLYMSLDMGMKLLRDVL
jgi:hypothetical protein